MTPYCLEALEESAVSIRTVLPVVAEEPPMGSSEFWSGDASALASSDIRTEREAGGIFWGNWGKKALIVSPDTCHLSRIINNPANRDVIYHSLSFSPSIALRSLDIITKESNLPTPPTWN